MLCEAIAGVKIPTDLAHWAIQQLEHLLPSIFFGICNNQKEGSENHGAPKS